MKKLLFLLLLIPMLARAQFPTPTGLTQFGSSQFFYKISGGDTTVYAKSSSGLWFPMGRASDLVFSTNFQGLGTLASHLDLANSIHLNSRVTADTGMRIGISTTPAWATTYKILNMAGNVGLRSLTSGHDLLLFNNIYNTAGRLSSWHYAADGYGSALYLDEGGGLDLYSAPSGLLGDSVTLAAPIFSVTRNGATLRTMRDTTVSDTIVGYLRGELVKIPFSGGGYVPTSRTLTINGTALDLSANRSWSVGTMTSLTPGYGFTSSTPITGSGTMTIDTAKLQTVLNFFPKGDTRYYKLSNPSAYIPLTAISATSPIFYNNTTGVISSQAASASQNGYLTSTDWSTFNGKQAAGNYITGLTGDAVASGPGNAVVTLANTAVTPGTYTNATITVDGKGRATAVSSGSGGSGVTTVTTLGTHENASISGSTINIPNMFGGTWQPFGRVMLPDPLTDGNILQEPTGIFEGSPQLITTATGSVFKILFTSGNATNNIYCAESIDGITWVRRSTIAIATHARPCLVKIGSTYYCYCVNQTGGFINVDVYSSSDMLTWTSAATNIITISGSAGWNHASLANMAIYYDGTTIHMLLSANAVGGGPFTTGYYHSTTPLSGWTAYAGNPVMGNITNLELAPGTLTSSGGVYYAWMFGGTTTGNLPTDIYRYHSADMQTWVADNSGSPTFARSQGDEGAGTSVGQVANPMLIPANGKMYMFYTADASGTAGYAYIKLAISNYSFSGLVATNEGNASALNPGVPLSYEKTASDLRYTYNSLNLNTVGTYTKGGINITTEVGGVGNGTGIRVRDTTTKTNITVITPDNIAFLKSGVTNTIQGNSTNMTFSAWGGYLFNNGSGSGAAQPGSLDNTGLLTTANGVTTSASGFTFNSPAFGATNTIGFSARNQVAATSGVTSRWSPAWMQDGTGWTGSASQLIQFNQILKPVSGTTPITYNYEWIDNINFAGDVTRMKLNSSGTLTLTGLLQHATFTVSTLPTASSNKGATAYVTDATGPAIGSTVVGGGAAFALVVSNGTNWTVTGI